MWVATVCSEIESSEAIWRLVSPRETSTATSSSRGVSAVADRFANHEGSLRRGISHRQEHPSRVAREDIPVRLGNRADDAGRIPT